MTIFGIDISHHQEDRVNLAQCRREGVEFVFIKATEGASYVDPRFDDNLRDAGNAGLIAAAYHYVRSNATAAAQIANILRVVPPSVALILDVEANSGRIGLTHDIVYGLRLAGRRVSLLYLPRWYWTEIDQPSLDGLPPLWSSRYPDTVVGALSDEYARVPASYWQGYGGLPVAVLQFTSSARVAGYAPIDANAFRGTRDQLATLLGYQQEENMKNLVLAKQSSTSLAIWVGDGIRRRHVVDIPELNALQALINQVGGDSTVRIVTDLRALGEVDPAVVPVELDYTRFVDDVVNQVVDRVADQVTDDVLAALETRGLGATVEQVEEVVRNVFRDAGSDAE